VCQDGGLQGSAARAGSGSGSNAASARICSRDRVGVRGGRRARPEMVPASSAAKAQVQRVQRRTHRHQSRGGAIGDSSPDCLASRGAAPRAGSKRTPAMLMIGARKQPLTDPDILADSWRGGNSVCTEVQQYTVDRSHIPVAGALV
jgi:hypothetical protein